MSTQQKTVQGTITFSKAGTYTIYAEVEDSLRNVTQTQPGSVSVTQPTTTPGSLTRVARVVGADWNGARDVAFSPDGKYLAVASYGANAVEIMRVTTTVTQPTTPTPTTPLSATLSVDRTSITVGQSVTFTIIASGGVPNYLASLINADTGAPLKVITQSFSYSTSVSLSFSTAGTYRIYAVVKDTKDGRVNTNTVTITVTQPTTPTPTAPLSATLSASKTSVRAGESFNLSIRISGGTAPYTVKIFRSDSKISNANIFTYGPTSSTSIGYTYILVLKDTYRFYATVTDGKGTTVTTNTVTVYAE